MGLSNLGILHTGIGIVAIVAAVIAFIRNGKIDLSKLTGKIYFYFTIAASLTSLGLSKQGGLNAGHFFSIFIVVLVLAAYFLHTKKKESKRARFFENFTLSFSFFLSWVPTINETFTRVPVGQPLAEGPTDPLIGQTLLVLLALFVIGSVYQYRKQKNINKSIEP